MQGPALWTVLTALGAGAILLKIVESVIAWATGRHGREQSAWEQRDREASARRKLEETLHRTRLVAIANGVAEDLLPPWPTYNTHSRSSGTA